MLFEQLGIFFASLGGIFWLFLPFAFVFLLVDLIRNVVKDGWYRRTVTEAILTGLILLIMYGTLLKYLTGLYSF